MQVKRQIKKYGFLQKVLVPVGIKDPDLNALCRSMAQMVPETILIYVLVSMAFAHFGLFRAASFGVFYCTNAALSMVLLRMGFTHFFRYWYMLVSLIAIGGVTICLGSDSFFWVWYLIAVCNTFFMTLEKERDLRLFGWGGIGIALAVVLVLLVFKIFPTEVGPEHHEGVAWFGISTVVYSSATLLFYVIRYQREVTLYKKRIEDQSVTMLQHAKMSSLGEMAAGVAHEINNPLGIIMGYAAHLFREMTLGTPVTDRMIDKVGKITKTTERIGKIVNALRTFSREAENDPFQGANVRAIVEDALYFCSENFKLHKIEIRVVGDGDIDFHCRQTQICQVLVNLINNSFEAVQKLPEKWVEISVAGPTDGRFQISITDSGKGISEKIADKIMQPFFTTKEIGKGTGLGLSVSKGIIESHQGTLFLDSNCPNTRFVVDLPMRQNATSAPLSETA